MAKKDAYSLQVPLDASGIDGYEAGRTLQVLVVDAKGAHQSEKVKLGAKGAGSASFDFSQSPGAVRVLVGPDDASPDELLGLQTLSVDVSARQWASKRELTLAAIRIPPYYWYWWLIWCRTFTINGRIVCHDGSPVPGAKVCAYDVDRFFWWCNTQQVGCATTDVTGSFQISFRWCCGWWPWWWWRYRVWTFDADIARRISTGLQGSAAARLLTAGGSQPSLQVFNRLLAEQGITGRQVLGPNDVGSLDAVRQRLVEKLPTIRELDALRIWPWWPWYPWWDCTPDIIFKATQDCLAAGTVIVDEQCSDARWNIPNPLNVTLVASDKACCIPICHDPAGKPCPGGECLVIERICGDAITDIGGNLGAPASPVGYLYPGAVASGSAAYNGDRPYAGTVTVEKDGGDMVNVDFYEIEMSTNGGVTWSALPAGGAEAFSRRWLETIGFTTGDVPFPFATMFDAGANPHTVVESREHFETNGGLGGWNTTRFWIVNHDLVVPIDSSKFGDGPYEFHVVGWQVAGTTLKNPRVLPICGSKTLNRLVLTFDNRVVGGPHDPSHNCGSVHVCTPEPDTQITSVKINGVLVNPCDTIDAKTGTLEIDFFVTDPDAHLATYSLIATYGLNLAVDLLAQPGSVLTALVAGTQVGPTYGQALAQGATAPHWGGGTYRLTMPVTQAFPEPCCYQLELRGYKRNVVSCDHGFAFNNLTEYTLGVGVC